MDVNDVLLLASAVVLGLVWWRRCSKTGGLHRTLVIVTDADLIHDALVKQGPMFASRPADSPIRLLFSVGKCTVNSAPYGPLWRALRRNFVAEIVSPQRVKGFSWIREWAMGNHLRRIRAEHAKTGAVRMMASCRLTICSILICICFGAKIPDELIVEIEEVMSAGTDTSATALEWVMMHLILDPAAQERVYDEVVAKAGKTARITEADVEALPYLQRFLEGGEGHDTDITGTRALRMMPFGAGRRICPAATLGVLHIQLTLANMIRELRWTPPAGEGPPDPTETFAFTVVMKNSLRAGIVERNHPPPVAAH
ncbi:Cytochrome P450 77A3 [Triticum urartu]|uniref:Cytochrome P450 77A3 n=1 Tax=Triticum urartu TaxID=4572 RepID=M8A6P3_TRIUA|nr:Cytochrome P450 77A3 [Triticum urartu]